MRRRDVLKHGAFGVLALSGCKTTTTTKTSTNARPDDAAAFSDVRERYFLRSLELNPVLCTYIGGDGYAPALRALNTKMRNFDADALADEASWLRGVRRDLDAMSTLRDGDAIDASVMRAQIDFVVHMLEDVKHQQRCVDTYAGDPFHGVDWLLQQMTMVNEKSVGTSEEWEDVVTRVDAVPAFLDVARAQLLAGVAAKNMPDRRQLLKAGIEGSGDSAKYFAEELQALAKGHTEGRAFASTMCARLDAAGKRAAIAFESFATFLGATYRPNDDSADRFAIGETEYAWRTRTCFLEPRSPGELFEHGAHEIARHQKLVFDVAREVATDAKLSLSFANDADARVSVRAVMAHLEKQAPKDDDELFRWYRDCIERSVAWGRATGMFDVPADYRLALLPTPPVLRGGGGASYYPPPVYKAGAVGRFYLDPTDNDPAALAANHRATVADTTTHEGFPGHDWHAKLIAQNARAIANVRWLCPGAVDDSFSMWADSMAAEGWGLYAEDLMAEPTPGRPHGFYDAAEHLVELQWQLIRAVRVRVDVGMHTGRMTFDEAVDAFTREASFLPDARAQAKSDDGARGVFEGASEQIERYAENATQAITYNLGKAAILELRDAAHHDAHARGEVFSPQRFHEHLLQQGMIPAGHLRSL